MMIKKQANYQRLTLLNAPKSSKTLAFLFYCLNLQGDFIHEMFVSQEGQNNNSFTHLQTSMLLRFVIIKKPSTIF